MGLFKKQSDKYTGYEEKENSVGTTFTQPESKFQKDYKAFMGKVQDNDRQIEEIWAMDVPTGIKQETMKKKRLDYTYHENFSRSRGSDVVNYTSYNTIVHLDIENYNNLKKEADKMGFLLDTKDIGKASRSFSIISDKREIIKVSLDSEWASFVFEPSDKYAYLVEYIIGMGKE
ncbi:MAG: hypothetical protein HZB68_04080 [Candidatus Aenigmarchaeota archaeon]|nr:hypothetical protein [Candidatus Aenigmarchaeota archaeon]